MYETYPKVFGSSKRASLERKIAYEINFMKEQNEYEVSEYLFLLLQALLHDDTLFIEGSGKLLLNIGFLQKKNFFSANSTKCTAVLLLWKIFGSSRFDIETITQFGFTHFF